MSNCNCIPCNPCETCDDDTKTLSIETIPSKQCDTNCCWGWCRDNSWINIQSGSDCLTVDTSECWVITLTAECPRPTYVEAWENVTVNDITPPSDCYIDWWDCWTKWWWKINATDSKVKACSWDSKPWTLEQKLQAGKGIFIDYTWCDWWDGKAIISFDDSVIPSCPEIPNVTIDTSNCSYVDWTASWHHIVLKDKEPLIYYAKIYLSSNAIDSAALGNDGTWFYLTKWGWLPTSWSTREMSWVNWAEDFSENFNKSWFSKWILEVPRDWLYNVGFSWTLECWFGIHWVRVQMYYAPSWQLPYTIIESRYSWPVGKEPYELNWYSLNYVTNVQAYGWWATGWAVNTNVSKWNFYIDAPIVTADTDANWVQGKSASLWAYVSRMPTGWSTIMRLRKWEKLLIWAKIQTHIDYDWSLLKNHWVSKWEIAILWRASWGNAGNECWLTMFADLIHPLNLWN